MNRRRLTMSNGRNRTMFMLPRNTSLRASIMCHTTKHPQSMNNTMNSTMNDTMDNTMNNTMNNTMTHIMSIMQLRPTQLRLLY
jgi:hypothetical protein